MYLSTRKENINPSICIQRCFRQQDYEKSGNLQQLLGPQYYITIVLYYYYINLERRNISARLETYRGISSLNSKKKKYGKRYTNVKCTYVSRLNPLTWYLSLLFVWNLYLSTTPQDQKEKRKNMYSRLSEATAAWVWRMVSQEQLPLGSWHSLRL